MCKYSMMERVFVCVWLHHPTIQSVILAAFLLKPMCPFCTVSTAEQPIVYSHSVHYIIHMTHTVFALANAWEISWDFASVPQLSQSSFVSLAYQRGGSLAVMLRGWLSPLHCIRQQWDWAVRFISANIKASKMSWRIIIWGADWQDPFIFGRWMSLLLLICPSYFEGQSRLLSMLPWASLWFSSVGYVLWGILLLTYKTIGNGLKRIWTINVCITLHTLHHLAGVCIPSLSSKSTFLKGSKSHLASE